MNDHGIRNERVISCDGDNVDLEIDIPADCYFFDGHFPQFKLLPAVGQFEIISRFAMKYFNLEAFIPRIRRMKFSSPILPGSSVFLSMQLNRDSKSVGFNLMDAKDHGQVHASGSFSVIPMQQSQGEGM